MSSLRPVPEGAGAGCWGEGVGVVPKYLISFPSGAMDVSVEELPAVSEASHAVVQQAKEAGVWVFGGGIDEGH